MMKQHLPCFCFILLKNSIILCLGTLQHFYLKIYSFKLLFTGLSLALGNTLVPERLNLKQMWEAELCSSQKQTYFFMLRMLWLDHAFPCAYQKALHWLVCSRSDSSLEAGPYFAAQELNLATSPPGATG